MEYRNARYTEFGTISCELNHPTLGWIPFTANPNDIEPIGAVVFNAAKSSAAPYVAPPVNLERLAYEARANRDELLSRSDWTQVPDAPVDRAAWAAYRQALRDVTNQTGFPATIDWPVAPV